MNLNEYNKLGQGQFAQGDDGSGGTPMSWVAIKTDNNWVIKMGAKHLGYTLVSELGNVVYDQDKIREYTRCDDDVLELYTGISLEDSPVKKENKIQVDTTSTEEKVTVDIFKVEDKDLEDEEDETKDKPIPLKYSEFVKIKSKEGLRFKEIGELWADYKESLK